MPPTIDLAILSTGQLLSYLQAARRCGGHYSPYESGGPSITIEEIKAELATRPHIPNRAERKQRQRLRQRAGRGRADDPRLW